MALTTSTSNRRCGRVLLGIARLPVHAFVKPECAAQMLNEHEQSLQPDRA